MGYGIGGFIFTVILLAGFATGLFKVVKAGMDYEQAGRDFQNIQTCRVAFISNASISKAQKTGDGASISVGPEKAKAFCERWLK